VISDQLSVYYTQEGNKLNFLKNKNHLIKPQRGDINIAWGSAPGNPSYDHVEYSYQLSLEGLKTILRKSALVLKTKEVFRIK
jgi:hypothetical protein